MVVNSSSLTRQALFAYARDFVARYQASRAVAFWELGNEFNLEMDGCGADPTPGNFFTTQEGMAFLRDYRDVILAVDPTRTLSTGMAHPRPIAYHAMQSPTGCIHASLPQDTLEQSATMLQVYSDGFDLITIHFYGCRSGNPYLWCNMSGRNPQERGDLIPFQLVAQVAQATNKVAYVGEYGATNQPPESDGYNATGSAGYDFAMAVVGAMWPLDLQISTLWAFACPSHGDTPNWCLHPGVPSHQNATFLFTSQLDISTTKLWHQGAYPWPNATLERLALPALPGGPACLDGSPYTFFYRVNDPSRWVLNLEVRAHQAARLRAGGACVCRSGHGGTPLWIRLAQGGGWSFDAYTSYQRSLTWLGSSRFAQASMPALDLGPAFRNFSQVFLPCALRLCAPSAQR
jgi:hypothetical protein